MKTHYILLTIEDAGNSKLSATQLIDDVISETNASWRNTHPYDEHQDIKIVKGQKITSYLTERLYDHFHGSTKGTILK